MDYVRWRIDLKADLQSVQFSLLEMLRNITPEHDSKASNAY